MRRKRSRRAGQRGPRGPRRKPHRASEDTIGLGQVGGLAGQAVAREQRPGRLLHPQPFARAALEPDPRSGDLSLGIRQRVGEGSRAGAGAQLGRT